MLMYLYFVMKAIKPLQSVKLECNMIRFIFLKHFLGRNVENDLGVGENLIKKLGERAYYIIFLI